MGGNQKMHNTYEGSAEVRRIKGNDRPTGAKEKRAEWEQKRRSGEKQDKTKAAGPTTTRFGSFRVRAITVPIKRSRDAQMQRSRGRNLPSTVSEGHPTHKTENLGHNNQSGARSSGFMEPGHSQPGTQPEEEARK